MALRVRLTPLAEADLTGIRAYLIPRSPQGAENVRLAIEASIDRLAEFPGIGRPTHLATVRVVMVSGYPFRIYHTTTGDELIIVHIRHAARRDPKLLPR